MSSQLSMLKHFDQTGRLEEISEVDGRIVFGEGGASWPTDAKTGLRIHGSNVSRLVSSTGLEPHANSQARQNGNDSHGSNIGSKASLGHLNPKSKEATNDSARTAGQDLHAGEWDHYTLGNLVSFLKSVRASDRQVVLDYFAPSSKSQHVCDDSAQDRENIKRQYEEAEVDDLKPKKIRSDLEAPEDTASNVAIQSNLETNIEDHFLKLPGEVIVKILSHLKFRDVATRVSLVSRRFLALSRDPSFWTSLPSNKPLDLQTLIGVLDRCPLLGSLSVTERAEADALTAAKHALQRCPRLKQLDIVVDGDAATVDPGAVPNMESLLKSIAEHGSSLRALTIKGNWDKDAWSSASDGIKNLTSITVPFNDLGLSGLKAIADHCRGLTQFNLKIRDGEDLTDEAMNYFLERVKPTLRTLWFCAPNLTDASFKNLGSCQLLEHLLIAGAVGMGKEGYVAISKLSGLKDLTLMDVDIHEQESIDAMFRDFKLRNPTQLAIFTVHSPCEPRSQLIADNCPELTDLKLTSTEYMDDPVHPPVEDEDVLYVLSKCSKLVKLDLSSCHRVTGAVLWSIPPQLRELTLDVDLEDRISRATLANSKKSNPDLRIEFQFAY